MKKLLAVLVVLLAVLLSAPTQASFMEPMEGPVIAPPDLPVIVLGKEEAEKMANHTIATGEEDRTADGVWFYTRTYDGGKAKPPGCDEYYNLKVYFIYVPPPAWSGFHIGVEYDLREGKQDKYGFYETRKVIQLHLDDGDQDLKPNSMIRTDIEFHYGEPVKYEYKSFEGSRDWKYWLYFWYDTYTDEGMK